MTNTSQTTKSLTPSERLERVKLNRLLLALAKLSPKKRAEIIKAEAKKRGLI